MFLDKKYIGNKFREKRKTLNLTQEIVAEKVGIAEKHYGRLERGLYEPSLETFFNIIYFLNIPLAEFGIDVGNYNNPSRETLLKKVYLCNDKELKAFENIIDAIKILN